MFQFDTFNNWNTPRSTRQHYILIIYHLSIIKKFYLKKTGMQFLPIVKCNNRFRKNIEAKVGYNTNTLKPKLYVSNQYAYISTIRTIKN